jgi:hypothetical protein
MGFIVWAGREVLGFRRFMTFPSSSSPSESTAHVIDGNDEEDNENEDGADDGGNDDVAVIADTLDVVAADESRCRS